MSLHLSSFLRGLLLSLIPSFLFFCFWPGEKDLVARKVLVHPYTWITRLPGAPRHVCRRFFIHQRRQWRRVHHVRRKSHQNASGRNRVDSFSKDDNGVEYITYEENPTKTRQGGLRKKGRVVQPKIFATGGPRCPVKLLKTFLSHRPEQMKSSGSFTSR